jgi:hypothetical protein
LGAEVPGTCRLQTKVTVKPGTDETLTLEEHSQVDNAGTRPF